MRRIAALALLWLLPARAGLFDMRLHVWAKVITLHGVELLLVIRGAPHKLTDREREVLNRIAHEMNTL
jgi:hypothetical protein